MWCQRAEGQAGPDERGDVAPPSVLKGGIGGDLDDDVWLDAHDGDVAVSRLIVVTAAHHLGPRTGPRCRSEQRRDEPLMASQQCGSATDDPQGVIVMEAEDEPLRSDERAGDGADDDIDGFSLAVLVPAPGSAPVRLRQAFDDDCFHAEVRDEPSAPGSLR